MHGYLLLKSQLALLLYDIMSLFPFLVDYWHVCTVQYSFYAILIEETLFIYISNHSIIYSVSFIYKIIYKNARNTLTYWLNLISACMLPSYCWYFIGKPYNNVWNYPKNIIFPCLWMDSKLYTYIHTYIHVYSETFLHAKHVHNVNISFRLQLILIPLIIIILSIHWIIIL